MAIERATAFAPGSVGNVGVGFDILGFAFGAVGDRVTVTRRPTPGVNIRAISGVPDALPQDAEQNTAGGALLAMQEALRLPFGFDVEIEKGIPLSSGLGGSAASAVAAVVAANALLDVPRPMAQLLTYALQGEAIASGSKHADNVAPCLYGGLVLAIGAEPPRIASIPAPAGVRAIVVHPHLQIATKAARAVLRPDVPMPSFIEQTANLAGFITGCFAGDLDLIAASLRDVVIEPQRAHLIPRFEAARDAALSAGALGCSISGAGPSVFAFAREECAEAVLAALLTVFASRSIASDGWVVDLNSRGAHVLPT
ncbi:MAG: homoserine kinase [Proteobacteria bacterium]|nr:homoserine kinase [Pseudomonadota bacterium]